MATRMGQESLVIVREHAETYTFDHTRASIEKSSPPPRGLGKGGRQVFAPGQAGARGRTPSLCFSSKSGTIS